MPIDELLAPISAEAPAGTDAAEEIEKLEEKIKGKQTETIVDGRPVATFEEPNWRELTEESADLLKNKSKHLRAAMIYCVACSVTRAWPGLHEGLEVMATLLESSWDTLHPVPEEGDPYERAGILSDLSLPMSKPLDPYNFVLRVQRLKLTQSNNHGSWSFLEMEAAQTPEQKLLGADVTPPSLEQINASWADLAEEPRDEMLTAVSGAVSCLKRIAEVFKDKKSKPDLALLTTILGKIERRIQAKGALSPADEPTDEARPEKGKTKSLVLGEIQSREDAVKTLKAVSAYFQRTEPSSPIPLLLKLALEVRNQTFVQILKRLSPSSVDELEKLFGEEGAGAPEGAADEKK